MCVFCGASVVSKVLTFFFEVKQELGKVTWAKFDEFVGHTVVVCITVAFVSVVLSLMDTAFNLALQRLLS